MGGAVGIVLSILGALSSALPAIEGDMAARQNREVQAAIHREVDLSRRLPPKSRMNAKLAALRADRLRHHCAVPPKYGGGRYHRICKAWTLEGARVHRELRGL